MHRFQLLITLLALTALLVLSGCAPKQTTPMTLESMLAGPPEEMVELTAEEHRKKGDLLLAQGKKELAFIEFNRALKKDPGNPTLHVRKGRMFLEQNIYEKALEEFTAALEADPAEISALYGAAQASFGMRRYAEAKGYLESVLQKEPEMWQAHNLLGLSLCAEKNFAEAIRVYERAQHLNPREGKILNNLGVVYSMKGEPSLGAIYFKQAAINGDATPRTFNNLGMALARQGKEREALQAFAAAGNEATAHNNLGYALFLQGEYGKAIPYFEKAIELSPTFYVRANENLKRARMAARLNEASPGQPQ